LPIRLESPQLAFGVVTRANVALSPPVQDLLNEIRTVAGEIGWLEQPPERPKVRK